MILQPYRIHCLTCSTPLRVTDPSLVGEILTCPKCHSMVLVTPPPGAIAPADKASPQNAALRGETSPLPEAAAPPPSAPPPVPAAAGLAPAAEPSAEVTESAAAALAADLAEVETSPAAAEDLLAPSMSGVGTIPTMPVMPEPTWRRWLTLSVSGVAGVLLTLGAWFYWTAGATNPRIADQPAADAPARSNTQSTPEEPKTPSSLVATSDNTPQPTTPQDKDRTEEPKPNPAPDASIKNSAPADEAETRDHAKPTSPSPDTIARPAEPPSVIPPIEPPGTPAAARRAEDAENRDVQLPELPSRDEPALSDYSEPPSKPLLPLRAASPALAARLATPLAEVKLPPMKLAATLRLLGEMAAVSIRFDQAALARAGVDPNDVVEVDATGISLGDLLSKALAAKGLGYVATGDSVIVTLPPTDQAPLRQVRYTVDDLAADDAAVEALAELVRSAVLPDTWDVRGGRGTVVAGPRAMLVSQTAEAHWQILLLCEKLRVARGLSPRSKLDPDRFSSGSRREQGQESLQREVTFRAATGAKLSDVVAGLSAASGVTLEVDELSLLRGGLSPDLPVALNVDGVSLEETLEKLLEPLGLTWQVLGPRVVSITTPASARADFELEVYPVRDLAKDAAAGEALAAKLAREVAPRSWQSSGGRGIVRYDRSGRCLIVLQPQPLQVQVEETLGRWGAQ